MEERREVCFVPPARVQIPDGTSEIPDCPGQVVGAFAWGFGVLTSDFGVGKSQDLGC